MVRKVLKKTVAKKKASIKKVAVAKPTVKKTVGEVGVWPGTYTGTITKDNAIRVLAVVNKGLSLGLGAPTPGRMCVEAAVSYAFDEGFNDSPKCVDGTLRQMKIYINDTIETSNKVRADIMRRIAIAQLGTAEMESHTIKKAIASGVINMVAREYKENVVYPADISFLIKRAKDNGFDPDMIQRLALAPTWGSTVHAAKNVIRTIRDKYTLGAYRYPKGLWYELCESIVKELILIKTPGSEFLYLTKVPKVPEWRVAKKAS